MQNPNRQKGFTIVELLIVVVVIAILATITIIAYNGIQDRAKQSGVRSLLAQTVKKIMLYAADNSDQYPANLAALGLTDTTGLQYTGGGNTFCVTATYQNLSYYQSATTQAAQGACSGHGLNGAPVVTNLVTNPSVETQLSSFGANNSSSMISRSADRAYSGSSSILIKSLNTTNGYNGLNSLGYGLTAGTTYTFSAWVYLPAAYSSTGVAATITGGGITGVLQGNFVTSTGDWRRTQVTFTPQSSSNINLYVVTGSGGGQAPADATFYADAMQLELGSTATGYGDGSKPGWEWLGTPNNSTSRGSKL